jgi:hypothetical protein
MKKVILLSGLIVFLAIPLLKSQGLIKNSRITGICYAGNKVKKIYIPPPDKFLKKDGSKSGGTINVYYSNTPSNIVNAVDFAASILESLLPQDAEITVLVSTGSMASGVLANSSTTALAGGWAIDALDPNAWYAIALAEKIYGAGLNDDLSPDISMQINTNVDWYLGTDGNTPLLQYDLVTVMIHELIHGLGFFDTMSADESTGSWGAASIPVIYDTFIENLQGQRLIDTLVFQNPSVELKNELTGEQLYFNGPLLKSANSGERIKIYAPSTYDPGSSISHLDEDTTPDQDALMTPYIDKGEAIHDPGKITMAMLGDFGWINTRFIHENPPDTEEHLTQMELSTTIVSDTLYDRNKVGLVWSFDGFTTSDTVFMISANSDNTFSATISVPYFDTRLEYYMYVQDCFSRTYRSPSYIDKFRYSVRIGMDTVRPVMLHTPIAYYLEKVDTIKFEALAADNMGIDTVYVEYRVNNGPSVYAGLAAGENYSYKAEIIAKPLSLEGGDTMYYRITASDVALVPNSKTLPENGFYKIRIEDIGTVVTGYSTDFTDASGDFLNIGFSISKPAYFLNYGLHTEHPYESPDTDGGRLDFTAMLRHPIINDANGMIITYMDLALVEPGEEGSVFGSEDFYDYVIIEGSKNWGKTWFPLVAGYDCRYVKSWETAYNSLIVNNNSTYIGQESMLQKRTVFPKISEYISGGDTMMIRFRLFSDPYARGWGWVIEDLHIGPVIDNVEKTNYESAVVFPNPGKGMIRINDPELMGKKIWYDIYNSIGTHIKTGIDDGSQVMTIDITEQSPGVYFIILHNDMVRKTLKYLLIK